MSWDSHTNMVFQKYDDIDDVYLCGTDGVKWGETGTKPGEIPPEDIKVCREPGKTTGLHAGSEKFMFITEADGYKTYNKGGKPCAVLKGDQYTAVAFGTTGTKANRCITCLEEFKKNLAGVGYN